MRGAAARAVFTVWPFSFAHERLMLLLDPPSQPAWIRRKLRGYPLEIEFDRGTYLGRFLDYRGMYEETLIRTMAGLLRPGMVMVDVGANIGLHTLVAAWRVGPTGRVLALEPQRRVHERLLANIALNGLTNVTVRRAAASVHEGELALYQPAAGNDGQATLALNPGESSAESEAVPVLSLDRLLAEALPGAAPDIIKMDVEGAELDVLRSAPEMFAKWPPAHLFIECIERHLNRFGATSGMLIRWLERAGYEVRGLHAGRWEPVPARDGVSMDLLASRS